ncbi:MAG: alkaline phosphatase family protein [Bryobacteraceae bacterium]
MASPIDKIKHMVVLMMENRSFDHLLGFTMDPDYPIDGLTGEEFNLDSAGAQVFANSDGNASGQLTPDPGHHFPDVNKQIFGNFQAAAGPGSPLSGFVTSYEDHTHDVGKSHHVMNCFDPGSVPVIATLARQYAVCDRWFSSVPGPTLPNRSFIHSATSIGRVDMSPIWKDETKTIYELLQENGVSARIFCHDSPMGSMAITFNAFLKNQKVFGLMDDFMRACAKDTLPAYSFIEPRYFSSDQDDNIQEANDQHPDHNMTEGETLIRDVYTAIRKNPAVWASTILVILYDEHGGLYDHVLPPATVNPDGKIAVNTGEDVAVGIPPFDFTRLGLRVPAVVISAYIPAGKIDSTVYDHTSVIATARKLFLGAGWKDKFLTQRDRQAHTFESLLTLTTPRADNFDFKIATDDGQVEDVADLTTASSLDKPLSEHQRLYVQHAHDLEQTLPVAGRTGIPLASVLTERDASIYLREVARKLRTEAPMTAGGQ